MRIMKMGRRDCIGILLMRFVDPLFLFGFSVSGESLADSCGNRALWKPGRQLCLERITMRLLMGRSCERADECIWHWESLVRAV